MSKLGKRLIASAKEAVAITRGLDDLVDFPLGDRVVKVTRADAVGLSNDAHLFGVGHVILDKPNG